MLGGTGPRGPGRGRLGSWPSSRPPRVGAARQGLSGTSPRVAARLISGDGEPHVGDALQGSDSSPRASSARGTPAPASVLVPRGGLRASTT